MNEETRTIAEKIKYYRKLRNMTTEELSVSTGILPSMLRKYESDVRFPKYEQIKSIANGLGMNVSAFLDLDVKTVGDAIALLMLIKGNSNIKWTGKKDKNGKYIPSSISFSFEDDELNQSLSDYLAIEEGVGLEINIEDQKARLLFNQTELKKPGE